MLIYRAFWFQNVGCWLAEYGLFFFRGFIICIVFFRTFDLSGPQLDEMIGINQIQNLTQIPKYEGIWFMYVLHLKKMGECFDGND